VIGINARAIPVFGENLGFAIPVDLAREVTDALIANGEVRRSWIGVSWQHLGAAPALAATPEGKGALVASVVDGSPADDLGLAPGDVVLSMDAQQLTAAHEEQLPHLRKWISDLPVGHTTNVVYLRDGEELHGTLVTRQLEDLETAEVEIREWGFTARTISEEMSRQLRVEDRSGALVTGVKPDSFSFEAGLRPGDIIRRMDDQDVPGLRVLEQRAQRLIEAGKPRVLLEINRGRTLNFILLELFYGSRSTAEPRDKGDDR
jgi:serine protease Do